jgi:hypothetical protein
MNILSLNVIVKAIIRALKQPENFVNNSKELPERDYPRLWQFVRDIAAKMNAKAPDNIIAGIEPSFYATEVKIKTPQRHLKGETLFNK